MKPSRLAASLKSPLRILEAADGGYGSNTQKANNKNQGKGIMSLDSLPELMGKKKHNFFAAKMVFPRRLKSRNSGSELKVPGWSQEQTHTHTHIHTHSPARQRTLARTHSPAHPPTHLHTCTHARAQAHAGAGTRRRTPTHAQAHINAPYPYTHTGHTHTHTGHTCLFQFTRVCDTRRIAKGLGSGIGWAYPSQRYGSKLEDHGQKLAPESCFMAKAKMDGPLLFGVQRKTERKPKGNQPFQVCLRKGSLKVAGGSPRKTKLLGLFTCWVGIPLGTYTGA